MAIRKLEWFENGNFYSECAIPKAFLMDDWRGGSLRPAYQSGILPALLNPSLVILYLSLTRGRENSMRREIP